MNQMKLATKEMIRWLSHQEEIGKMPARIHCTYKFDYLNMTYYIFKFTQSFFDKYWMLGVCGGYEENAVEHCGHIFSKFDRYDPSNEKENAIELIEIVRLHWIERSKGFTNR